MTVQHTEADPPPKLLNQLGPGKDSSALGALKLLLACFCAHGSHSRSLVKQGSTTIARTSQSSANRSCKQSGERLTDVLKLD